MASKESKTQKSYDLGRRKAIGWNTLLERTGFGDCSHNETHSFAACETDRFDLVLCMSSASSRFI
jgi:hypothetical protein